MVGTDIVCYTTRDTVYEKDEDGNYIKIGDEYKRIEAESGGSDPVYHRNRQHICRKAVTSFTIKA